jgi:hypothetical protein
MNIGQVVKYGESDFYAPKKRIFPLLPVAAGIAAALMFVMFFAGLFNKESLKMSMGLSALISIQH